MPRKRRKIDPMVDCVFKKLLGSEDYKLLTADFLKCFTGLEVDAADVVMINPFIGKLHAEDKSPVVDVFFGDKSGNSYQLEAQAIIIKELAPRVVYGWSKILAGSLNQGIGYHKVKSAISIWVLRENLFPREQTDAVILKLRMACPEEGVALLEESYIVLVQLSNYPGSAKISAGAERWVRFFKEGKDLNSKNLPAWADDEVMRMAVNVVEGFSQDRLAYYAYMLAEERQRVEATREQRLIEADQRMREADQRMREADQRMREADQRLTQIGQQLTQMGQQLTQREQQLTQREQQLTQKDQQLSESQKEREALKAEALARERELLRQIEELRKHSGSGS